MSSEIANGATSGDAQNLAIVALRAPVTPSTPSSMSDADPAQVYQIGRAHV